MDSPKTGPGLSRLQGFQSLMPYRIREVLLVASRYDSFVFEEEGLLTDLCASPCCNTWVSSWAMSR